ncbi:probable G-protein coupled receptor 179 isoform X4 [Pipra filicauda]|uniref:Probable G-protein coupled receptor 179 isoform X4 n=1 Tax=Pipra filicauda TaxID=649802 RepID=A0A7R5L4D8_9PASS|nr:probable G-protein coupled receptor 179 isoform X4 [Pipra filicauda]
MEPRRWPLLWGVRAVLVHLTVLTAGQRPQERPPRPAGWSPGPSSSWAPTLEPGAPGDAEGSAAALAFLRTGDAQRLARANCSGGVAAGPPGPGPPPALRAALRAAPEALAHTANFLNMLFQTNDIREASVAEDVEWYQALVRSLAEGHPWVRRAVLALDAHPLAPKPRLMLQATKGDGQILLQDVSASAPSLGNLSWDNEWFNALKSQQTPQLRKRVLSNDLRSMETPKWQRGDSYVGDPGHVRWSPPFLECREGRFLPAWAVTLSSAFYGLKPDLSPEFKGVVRVDVELRDVAIDQCASGPGWFSDTHRCDLNSTQCVPQESRGFVLGRYLCRCRPGFYGAGGVASGAWAGPDGGSRLACWPCRPGCATCEDDKPCLIQEDPVLRAAVLSCQACCMLAIFLSMLVSYHFRRSKRIRASGIILLETILFGSLLLYFPVFILYFKPSIFRCIVLRWVRMLGFATVYGTITLKLYRVLKVFLSRSAQRAPYVSSGRVLKLLAPILLLVLWFLAAWTIGMLENVSKNIPLVIRTQTTHGLHFYICGHDCWDYMMVIAEMLFLLWGSFLCYATRAVPSAFHEPRYMGIALHNELMISAAFHVVRFIIIPSLHPDWTLLLFFAHTHGTVTMTLALLFIPKFLHRGSPLREEITAEVYEDELDMRRSGSCLNSSIASAWSEHSLDPDDIREELKKLYRQLEVHKTWRMATNNPHLPRKRSSRRSLARSILRRGAEPPEAPSRRSSAGDRGSIPGRRGSSARRPLDAGGTGVRMRDEGSRRRSSALRKSRSSEGPPRGSPGPGILPAEEPSPGREEMDVTLERSDSDSLDAAPLVCKSASAQNLSGHWQRPPARAPALQKSHSVVTGAREEALLAASRAAREGWHSSRQLSAPASRHPPGRAPPGDAGKAKIPGKSCSQEDTSPLGDAKVQKHVTYAPTKSVSIDSAHPPRKVRVAVRKTPPVPPVRYESLGRHSVPAGDSLEPAEPPRDPPAPAGEAEGTPEGTPEGHPGRSSPPAGKGGLLSPPPISAQVCPWELIQDEILSRKQKAAEAADSGSAGDTETPEPKPPPAKTFRSLGLAIKALNRSRGKSVLRGRRESEGSFRKRGSSRREKSSLAEASATSLGGTGPAPPAKSPEGGRQRPEPPSRGYTVPCQHNNNAATPGEATGWGDSGTEGHWDGLAPGTAGGDEVAEQPSGKTQVEPQEGDGAPGADPGKDAPAVDPGKDAPAVDPGKDAPAVHPGKDAPAVHPGKDAPAVHPGKDAPAVDPGKDAPAVHPGKDAPAVHPGKDAPAAHPGKDAPAVTLEEGTAKGLQRTSGSIQPQEHTEEEQPPAKPAPSSPQPSTTSVQGEARGKPGAGAFPPGSLGIPAGRGALLRQEAVASREDGGLLVGEESPAKVLEKGSSQAEPLGPGGSRDTARAWDAAGKAGSVPKPSSHGSVDSTKATICPWEVEDEPRPRTEICPWEEAAAPAGKEGLRQDTSKREGKPGSRGVGDTKARTGGRWEQRGDTGMFAELVRKSLEKAESKKSQSMESIKEEICPWESLGTEKPPEQPPARSTALPKSPSKKSQSTESLKAEICPWEDQEPKSSDKANICPWEGAEPPSGKEKLRPSTVSKSPSASRGLLKETGVGASGKEEKAKRDRESVCPWESTDMEQPQAKPHTGSIQPSKKSAEICPWEDQEPKSSDKAEICPWESTEQPPGKARAGSTEPSKKSQSKESLKAEICPWEDQEPKSSDKAEICPWEGAEPPSQQPKAKQVSQGGSRGDKRITRQAALASPERSPGKGSRDREAVCPWESLGTQEPSGTSHVVGTGLPKSPSGKSQSVESLKAEICPWEGQEVKSSDRAEICPWEGAEAQLEKGAAPGKDRVPPKEVATSKPVEKGSRDRESICPWESTDMEQPQAKPRAGSTEPSKKSQSKESLKAEICPWEAQEPKSSDRAEICPWESTEQPPGKARAGSTEPSKKSQSTESLKAEICPWEDQEPKSSDKAEICPWESTDTEQLLGKARAGSTEPSKKSQSVESLKAEICPWEAQEPKSSDKAEICPWESTEQPPGKARAGSTEPSKKSQSKESLKAEICPWEDQEPKSSDKAEICPWEGAEPPSQQPKAKQVSQGGSRGDKRITRQAALASPERSPGKGSRDREAVCPWESLGTQEPSGTSHVVGTGLPKSPSGKSQSVESLKAEICPWEGQEVKSSDRAEICPWEGAEAQLEKGAAPGKDRVPPKEVATSKPVEKGSRDRESVCPWESTDMEQPQAKPRAGSTEPSKKSQSKESLKAEICPWEAQEPKSSDRAEICPWESTEQPPGKARAGSTEPSKKSQSTESLKAEICPWEAQEPKSSDKAEICPWEVAAPQLDKGTAPGKDRVPPKPSKPVEKGSRDRESVCPWESTDTEDLSLKTVMEKEPSKKSDSTESRKSEICPWEAAEPTGWEKESSKAGVHPWGADRTSHPRMGKPKPVAGASVGSPTALLEKSKGSSDGEAKHKPLCRLLPSLQPPGTGSSSSPGTGLAEVCPWEAEEAPSAPAKPSTDTRKSSEVCPWEEEGVDPTPTHHGQSRARGTPRDGEGGERETQPEVCPWDHQ